MADSKITALTAISTVDPAADPLVIVDVSDTSMAASGTTKKGTINQLLGAGGTATLASATITGDLTVDTNVLKVDTTNNVVGIGTATPQQNLHVVGTGTTTIAVERSGATIAGRFEFVSGNSTNLVRCVTAKDLVFEQATGTEVYRISSTGVATWSNVGGVAGTAMTLNATGLGLGVSPVTALSFPIGTNKVVGQSATSSHAAGNVGSLKFGIADGGGDYSGIQIFNTHNGTYSSQDIRFFTGEGGVSTSTERMRITPSGNVGFGVTPSAWGTYKGLQVGYASLAGYAGSDTFLGSNVYFDGGAFRYISTATASNYRQLSGVHQWNIATSGTAGNAISFTQAMTLDASGNLILLSSNTPATLTTNGQLTVNATSNTNLRFSYRGSDGTTRVANITLA